MNEEAKKENVAKENVAEENVAEETTTSNHPLLQAYPTGTDLIGAN